MRKLANEELGRLSVADFKETDKMPVVLVLDNIRSANNVGSVFRTGDAFLVEAIHLCGITAQPPHRDIRKTAIGATESVDWKYFEQTIDSIRELKEAGYQIIAIEQAEGSTMLNEYRPNPNSKLALVYGNEVKGVDQAIVDIADVCLEIPQFGTKHSLNISVSVGVTVWECWKKLS